jgi:hypothetical protein
MSRRNRNTVVEIPKPEVTPRGLPIAEAAVHMGASPWFVEEEIRAGRLPALKLCRLLYVAQRGFRRVFG